MLIINGKMQRESPVEPKKKPAVKAKPIETAKKEPSERAVKPKPQHKKKDKEYASPYKYPEKE